jgi:hypothetical protein
VISTFFVSAVLNESVDIEQEKIDIKAGHVAYEEEEREEKN